jgi:transcriptional regulator with XRE-family HTH domain
VDAQQDRENAMLAASQITEIRQLLRQGRLSERKIARQCGVSRNTVARIAEINLRCRPVEETAATAEDADPLDPAETPRRCPGCGGLVLGRCRLCCARSRRAAHRPAPPADAFVQLEGLLELDLKPAHRRRYEEVRARRLASGEPNPPEDRPQEKSK